ncbi:hypothetical protein D3C73_900560 [compost metagenome]
MKFKELFIHFGEMKHYIIAAALVFSFGIFLGWQQPEQLANFLKGEIKSLQSLSGYISEKENPQLWFFFVIFLNNASKAVIFIFLGLLFGILPLSMLVVNGLVLGYVLSAEASNTTWLLVVKGILPHGIIEIPAIFIACAYGIKLGVLVGKMMLHIIIPVVGKTARTEFTRVMRLTKPLIALLVLSLLAAAVIESTITFWIMRG